MSPLTPEVATIKTTLDELVLASPDPNATMAAIVTVWCFGGTAGDDLLDDLEPLAVSAAMHRGIELTAPELLEAYGHPERAQRVRDAVDAGRATWLEAAARAARVCSVTLAREAA